jgi:hypothetical protein
MEDFAQGIIIGYVMGTFFALAIITILKDMELKLGDKLEWLFRNTGIKWVVKKINPNCNCDERQSKMNEFQFKRK